MLKKIAVIGGLVAVAGLGLGGVALAESNSTAPQAAPASQGDAAVAAAVTTPASPSTTGDGTTGKGTTGKGAKAKAAGRDGLARRLEKVSHAQWVSKDAKTGTFVTHDAVRGVVSTVTSASITIKATDGTSETYVVDSSTKVHVKGDAKGAAGAIAQIKVGDQVGVLGTGAGTMTATQVIDRGIPKVTTSNTAPTTS
jgi:hypothetical protein